MTKTGRRVKCTNCAEYLEVPDRFYDFPCPHCGHTITDPLRQVRKGD